ncbi:pyruvoyl-dependent arginine decarboxylase [Candidatus Micrarchaeota archaeon]|nr:pyruvoyl-dependent arginine decarboxylase [Candidatus Micrarchaeota archaeon]
MNCLGIARKVCLVSGSADSETKLNAFDNALIKAKIHNLNLMKVSSILAKDTEICEGFNGQIEEGSFVPGVISSITSKTQGERLISGVAAAKTNQDIGFIVELSEKGVSKTEMEKRLRNKLEIMARERNLQIAGKPHMAIAEHKVKMVGCALTVAVFVF